MSHFFMIVDLVGFMKICPSYYDESDKNFIGRVGHMEAHTYSRTECYRIEELHARPIRCREDGQVAYCVRCKHVVRWIEAGRVWGRRAMTDDLYDKMHDLPKILGESGTCVECCLD